MEKGKLHQKRGLRKASIISIFLIIVFIHLASFGLAQEGIQDNSQKNVYFFWGEGCPHCENVEDSGVLGKANNMENVGVKRLEVYNNQSNREFYIELASKLDVGKYERGIPFLVIECEKGYSYFVGDTPIINNLENSLKDCTPMKETSTDVSTDNPGSQKLTLGSIVVAALIDSVNPCAFGVLIFLLATLLTMSSPKRALKYGMIYVAIIFLVYFFAGIGIMEVLNNIPSILNYVIIGAGILIFIGALIEIKDFFWYGKGISLKIPSSMKPKLEKISKKGTLPAVILLGIIVALVELPCTGGIYLGILSMMTVNKVSGVSYLLLYNLIFVLPLIVMVLFAYKGIKTEKIQNWVEHKKGWMRLAAGIVMIGLAFYLLNSVYSWI